jgi:DeoR/GlpR family transcriptional regulator of sugar metabolism
MTDPETRETMNRFLSGEEPGDLRQARQLDRRRAIAEAVVSEGSMRIEDIADRFGISLMTAHRDLDELASRALLRKTRGVASASPTSLVEASDGYRARRQTTEKSAIAAAAARLVEPGQALLLDDSTTVARMVPHLAERTPLTVITNSLTLMTRLKGMEELTLLGLGGRFHDWCNAFMGRMTIREIGQIRADTVFLSMAAITDGIVFHQSAQMADTKRAMCDAAARRVLLADHAKFERRALHGMAALDEFDAIVVDPDTSSERLAGLRSHDIEVIVAGGRG